METDDKKFEIVPSKVSDITMSGHGTVVHRRPTVLGGDIVQKSIRPDGAFKDAPDVWMDKVKNARNVADKIRALNNPAYDVPKTYIAHGRVYEQMAQGVMLMRLAHGYLEQNKDWLIPAVANFINDMSELYPVKFEPRPKVHHTFPGIWLPNRIEVKEILLRYPSVIKKSDINFIKMIVRYLGTLPEAKELVFAHNDLNKGNIFIDTDNKRLTIIDFEMAGYVSKMATMYHVRFPGQPEIMDYINKKLPRKTNPKLQWNYNRDIASMYDLVTFASHAIRHEKIELIKQIPARCAEMRKLISEKQIKFKTATTGMKRQMTKALVPISHYGRD